MTICKIINPIIKINWINYIVISLFKIGHLQAQFNKIAELSGTPGEMKRLLFQQMFVDVFGVTDNVMLDNMFRYFDADGEGSVSF